ncbi:MAG TPA: hypothetical protein PLD88_09385, partial [Candidatus Berkiella sp.]|nr:hypothetical protein [Candidatus Berkiella sp.]
MQGGPGKPPVDLNELFQQTMQNADSVKDRDQQVSDKLQKDLKDLAEKDVQAYQKFIEMLEEERKKQEEENKKKKPQPSEGDMHKMAHTLSATHDALTAENRALQAEQRAVMDEGSKLGDQKHDVDYAINDKEHELREVEASIVGLKENEKILKDRNPQHEMSAEDKSRLEQAQARIEQLQKEVSPLKEQQATLEGKIAENQAKQDNINQRFILNSKNLDAANANIKAFNKGSGEYTPIQISIKSQQDTPKPKDRSKTDDVKDNIKDKSEEKDAKAKDPTDVDKAAKKHNLSDAQKEQLQSFADAGRRTFEENGLKDHA